MTAPLDLPVAEMAARVRDPKDPLTAHDLVNESLTRIRARDPSLNAFLTVTEDLARAQAAAVDAKVARGEDPGTLAGIPLAVKDNLAVRDVPLTCASRILKGYIPPTAATSVERALAAGAVIVGKTNLDEFAMGSSTENSAFGPSRNPYDRRCVPGGSSGGSAAAVASGMVPLALGSDTGGSIRQPAALCGIVGLLPTYGRVSRSGLVAFGSSLDQVGPMARRAEDARALQLAIQGVDELDATTRALPAIQATEGFTPHGLRVARVAEFDAAVQGDQTPAGAAVECATQALVAAGAKPSRLSLPLCEQAIPVYYLVAPAEASSNLARFDGVRYGHRAQAENLYELYARSRDEGFGAEVKRRILLGTFALSAGYADAYYKRAMAARQILKAQFASAFEWADVLISATTPGPAFRLGEKAADPLAMYLCDVLTVAANLAGVPALSIPTGLSEEGLPLGLQLWAAPGKEGLLFDVAAWLERAGVSAYTPPPAEDDA